MFEKYIHHGSETWVRSEIKGKHREYCLCFSCDKFNLTDREKNCPKANMLYALDVALKMTTPVFECEDFNECTPDPDMRSKCNENNMY